MIKDRYKMTQYTCAVLLIVTSIALAYCEVFRVDNVPAGVQMYIAQAFLLAGSIFGLDYYVKKLAHDYKKENTTQGDTKQQSP